MKYNKKQLKVINRLILDLDELDNKPYRLFNALIDFAGEFKPSAIPSIKNAREEYYYNISEGSRLRDMIDMLRDYRIEQWEREEEEFENANPPSQKEADEISEALHKKFNNRIIGADEFVKKYMIDYFDNRFVGY